MTTTGPTPDSGTGPADILLGRPLPTSQEKEERLTNPVAMAVLSSDALSSVAYATEEMVKVLVPVAGIAAFSYVLPISGVIILLLLTLVFSYRQTIRAYPSAGGAYIVTRDNFGLTVAQVAGVALLLDYVMTVCVSSAAGVAAIYSAFPAVFAVRIPLSVALIWLIALVNLRGVRMTGRVFAAPTYLFMVAIVGLLIVGLGRLASGSLHAAPPAHLAGSASAVTLFVILHAYASGTTALTGVEAISNGVPIFKPVEWRNARRVLTWMGAMLVVLFGGIGVLTWRLKPIPNGKETLISLLGRSVFGKGGGAGIPYFFLQVTTTIILVLAANTSFADFPRLASFHAGDGFLPRPFHRRGRRLVFSTGIVVLAAAATLITVVLGADVDRLIPLYAVGVFLSFTFSQAGMSRRHLRRREEGWRRGLAVNGLGAVGSGAALIAITLTKFTQGAWAVVVLIPLGVLLFLGINRHYQRTDQRLRDPAHTQVDGGMGVDAVVLVTQVDDGTERALRYADRMARVASVTAVHAGRPDPDLAAAFEVRFGRPLESAPGGRDRLGRAADALRRRSAARPDRLLVAVVPRSVGGDRAQRRSQLDPARLRRQLRDVTAAVVDIPTNTADQTLLRGTPPRHAVVVPVDSADAPAQDALTLARLIGGDELHAMIFDREREDTDRVVDEWSEKHLDPPLEVVASPYRDPADSIRHALAALRGGGVELVTVVVPQLVPRWWQRPLYSRDARRIERALAGEPATVTVVAPHRL